MVVGKSGGWGELDCLAYTPRAEVKEMVKVIWYKRRKSQSVNNGRQDNFPCNFEGVNSRDNIGLDLFAGVLSTLFAGH